MDDSYFDWDPGLGGYEDDAQGFLDTANSLVKPSDTTDYGFGIPSAYKKQIDLLESSQEASDNKALELLQRSLHSSADVTPTQALATALLAAIPSIGGYMIGKSVGRPDLPPGYFEAGGTRAAIGLDKLQDPASEGGFLGTAGGAKAAGGYLAGLDADQKQANDVYQKMSAIESNKSARYEQEAAQLKAAGLNAEQIAARQEDSQAFQREMNNQRPSSEFDQMSPAQQRAYLANRAGVDEKGNPVQEPSLRDRVIVPAPRVFEKAAAADNLPVLQQRVRDLYQQAFTQIGPGFVAALERRGLAAFPANIQNEFMSTLNSMAMELNRAVDPTPSEGGRAAQLQLLEGSIANGHFLDLLDFKVSSARQAALNELKPFTLGDNANAQAKQVFDAYQQKWGLNQAGGPPDSGSSSGGVPAVGGTFNGQKVTGVRQIK